MDSASEARQDSGVAARPSLVAGATGSPCVLDNIIHQRVRLGITATLATGDALGFTRLKRLLGLTDGNLSVHLQKLEKAGYVSCEKIAKRPGFAIVSRYRLTRSGRDALQAYLAQMEAIIEAARGVADGGAVGEDAARAELED